MAETRDPQGNDAGDEPRAADVIAGRVQKDELDPVTMQQLAAWFGGPASSLEPPEPKVETPIERERRELWERRQRAMNAVDLALVEALETKRHAGDPLIRLPEPMTLPIESPLAQFDMSVWRLHLFDVREWEVPEDLSDAMADRAPQAMLRDLHRPVLQWPKFLQPMDLGMDVGGERTRGDVQKTVRTRYQVRMTEWPRSCEQAAGHMADLRARLRQPWGNIEIPESRRHGASTTRSAEDLRWFGDVGYDPDL